MGGMPIYLDVFADLWEHANELVRSKRFVAVNVAMEHSMTKNRDGRFTFSGVAAGAATLEAAAVLSKPPPRLPPRPAAPLRARAPLLVRPLPRRPASRPWRNPPASQCHHTGADGCSNTSAGSHTSGHEHMYHHAIHRRTMVQPRLSSRCKTSRTC